MAAASFPSALAFTLKYEGGKSNDPRDPGGRTNEGITQKTYDDYRYKKARLARRDVYEMAPQERDDIYKNEYWNKVTGDSLAPGVDLCIFDFAVNSGPDRALRTYATVGHSKEPVKAIHDICSKRLSFLHALRTWQFFGSGWAKRVAACEVKAVQISGAPLKDAHNAVRDVGRAFIHLSIMLATGVSIVVSKGIHVLPWWALIAIGVVSSLLIFNFFHRTAVTKVRVSALSDAQSKADALILAMSKMQTASKGLQTKTK